MSSGGEGSEPRPGGHGPNPRGSGPQHLFPLPTASQEAQAALALLPSGETPGTGRVLGRGALSCPFLLVQARAGHGDVAPASLQGGGLAAPGGAAGESLWCPAPSAAICRSRPLQREPRRLQSWGAAGSSGGDRGPGPAPHSGADWPDPRGWVSRACPRWNYSPGRTCSTESCLLAPPRKDPCRWHGCCAPRKGTRGLWKPHVGCEGQGSISRAQDATAGTAASVRKRKRGQRSEGLDLGWVIKGPGLVQGARRGAGGGGGTGHSGEPRPGTGPTWVCRGQSPPPHQRPGEREGLRAPGHCPEGPGQGQRSG